MSSRPLAIVLTVLALSLAPLALGATPGERTIPQLQVREAWIRWLPSNLPAGGYLSLANRGERALELTAVTSPVYEQIALHRTAKQEGSSRMQPIERISIPAHSLLSFAASGYHLMLMQPTRAVAPGDQVEATLHFAGGQTQAVQFEVRNPDGSSARAAPAAMPQMPPR